LRAREEEKSKIDVSFEFEGERERSEREPPIQLDDVLLLPPLTLVARTQSLVYSQPSTTLLKAYTLPTTPFKERTRKEDFIPPRSPFNPKSSPISLGAPFE